MKHKQTLTKKYNKTDVEHHKKVLCHTVSHRFNRELGRFEPGYPYSYHRNYRWGATIILDHSDFCFYPLSGVFRSRRTFQEIAAHHHSRFDDDECGIRIKRRACRSNAYLSAWEVEKPSSMANKRSWKMAYKCRNQWGINL
jgi:hypothetical protein